MSHRSRRRIPWQPPHQVPSYLLDAPSPPEPETLKTAPPDLLRPQVHPNRTWFVGDRSAFFIKRQDYKSLVKEFGKRMVDRVLLDLLKKTVGPNGYRVQKQDLFSVLQFWIENRLHWDAIAAWRKARKRGEDPDPWEPKGSKKKQWSKEGKDRSDACHMEPMVNGKPGSASDYITVTMKVFWEEVVFYENGAGMGIKFSDPHYEEKLKDHIEHLRRKLENPNFLRIEQDALPEEKAAGDEIAFFDRLMAYSEVRFGKKRHDQMFQGDLTKALEFVTKKYLDIDARSHGNQEFSSTRSTGEQGEGILRRLPGRSVGSHLSELEAHQGLSRRLLHCATGIREGPEHGGKESVGELSRVYSGKVEGF